MAQSDAVTGDRNYGEIVGTGKAQDLKQNTQLLAQGGGYCGDRGEETKRAQKGHRSSSLEERGYRREK